MHTIMKVKNYLSTAKRFVSRTPNYVYRTIHKTWQLREASQQGIKFVEPNFIYIPRFGKSAAVIDAGCGSVAELSSHMIATHQAECYGIDPTKKHQRLLIQAEKKHRGQFTYLPYALAATNETLTFLRASSMRVDLSFKAM